MAQYSLYPYQEKFINEIVQSARSGHKRIACISPTGSGKTVVTAHLLERCVAKKRKCLFLVTINCLVSQTAEKLAALGLKFGIISGSYKNPNYDDADIFIASLQTLASRKQWLDYQWDVAVFDEVHTSGWFGVADRIINNDPKRWILGFTATPYRLSKKQFFSDIFTDAIIAPSMSELIELGTLVPLHYYDVDCHTDFSKTKIVQGDYSQSEVSKIVNAEDVINNALDGREKYGKGKRTICFAVNVSHAESIAKVAKSRGIVSAVVTGSTLFSDRQSIFKAMKRGEIELIASCMALSTGFDLPEVEVAMLMRPTKSTALLDQQIGRVARIAKGKTHGIVLDTVGNFANEGHELPCEKVHTKESVLARKEPVKGEAPTKLCKDWENEGGGCGARIPSYHKHCPHCGFIFPVKEKEIVKVVGSYNRILTPSMVRKEGTIDAHRDYYRVLLKKHYSKGLTIAYVKYSKAKFELSPKPPKANYQGAIFGDNPTQVNFDDYYSRVLSWAALKDKDESKVDWLMRQEFGRDWQRWLIKDVAA